MPIKTEPGRRSLSLGDRHAHDLMTPNPQSLCDTATVREAAIFLTNRGFSAAPVIDRAGRPVGVLSRSDLVAHDREQTTYVPRLSEFHTQSDLMLDSGERLPEGFQVETDDTALVRDVMTPAIFSVTLRTSARDVVEQMVGLKVHRLFVVDDNGVLVGIISAIDVLRHLL
jgi:CBS domain-containing protein